MCPRRSPLYCEALSCSLSSLYISPARLWKSIEGNVLNYMWISRFENRHNAGVGVTVIAKCNTHARVHTHTRARARRRILSILPIPNRHIISIFDILYCSKCSGVLRKQFSFVQWIVLKPVGVKFHWWVGGGGGRILPHNGSGWHFAIFK